MALKVPLVTGHGLVLNESYHKIVHINISLPILDNAPAICDSKGNELSSQKVVRFRVLTWIDEAARRAGKDPLGEPQEFLMELNGQMLIEEQCYEFLKNQRGYEEAQDV